MGRVLVLVEGPTERAIVEQVLAPDLGIREVYMYARVVGKPGHKGGNNFEVARREIRALLRQEPNSLVTMFFDYYGLSNDWPGVSDAKGKTVESSLSILKQAIAEAVALDMGSNFDRRRFLPYVQFHEVESLLYSDPEQMARIFERPDLGSKFEEIVSSCGGCEKINDHYETAPSKRIQSLFPAYKKGRSVNAHAVRIAQHIGMTRIRQECPLFDSWCSNLEQYGKITFVPQ